MEIKGCAATVRAGKLTKKGSRAGKMNKNNLSTAERFVYSWKETPTERLGPEIVSVFDETNRKPNDFHLVVIDGNLVDPETRQPVKIDRSSYLGNKEGEFFDLLEDWANNNSEGSVVCISPLFEGEYPCNKLIHYEIAYTFGYPPEKVLLSTAILFDTSKDHCLEIAKKLKTEPGNFKDPEALRNKLFTFDQNVELVSILEMILSPQEKKQTPSQETISYFVNLIKSGTDPYFVAREMQKRGILGQYSISCPPSVNINNYSFVLNFTEVGRILCCTCPFCNKQVEAEIKAGRIHCPSCGAERKWRE